MELLIFKGLPGPSEMTAALTTRPDLRICFCICIHSAGSGKQGSEKAGDIPSATQQFVCALCLCPQCRLHASVLSWGGSVLSLGAVRAIVLV